MEISKYYLQFITPGEKIIYVEYSETFLILLPVILRRRGLLFDI